MTRRRFLAATPLGARATTLTGIRRVFGGRSPVRRRRSRARSAASPRGWSSPGRPCARNTGSASTTIASYVQEGAKVNDAGKDWRGRTSPSNCT